MSELKSCERANAWTRSYTDHDRSQDHARCRYAGHAFAKRPSRNYGFLLESREGGAVGDTHLSSTEPAAVFRMGKNGEKLDGGRGRGQADQSPFMTWQISFAQQRHRGNSRNCNA